MVRGAACELATCEVLIAGDFEGLAAISRRDAPIAELVALNAFTPWQGVGTALLAALPGHLGAGFARIRLTTTNDNVDALRFYQRRGYRLANLQQGAVDLARRHKPSIPQVGDYGIPIHDEIDLVIDLNRTTDA
jgi:hypothetical protein